jgi:hypothetical protein
LPSHVRACALAPSHQSLAVSLAFYLSQYPVNISPKIIEQLLHSRKFIGHSVVGYVPMLMVKRMIQYPFSCCRFTPSKSSKKSVDGSSIIEVPCHPLRR